jgi:hypothetical protein
MRKIMEKIVQTNLKYQGRIKKAYREGVDGGEAWHTERGGMRIIMGKIVQTNLKYQGWAKKHIGEGADDGLVWHTERGGMRINMEKNSSNKSIPTPKPHPLRHSMQGACTRSVESPSGCHRIGMLRGVCAHEEILRPWSWNDVMGRDSTPVVAPV